GSQGEWGAALHRLMMESHPDLTLNAGDTVILSSKTIPGNEASVKRLVHGLRAKGVEVIEAEDSQVPLHASGHPCQDELRDLYQILKPDLVIPVHGESSHMKENARLAKASGATTTFTGENGDLFYLSPTPGVRRRFAPVGRLQWCEETSRLINVA
ncbi:MAG: MBL fold metallo-hydrolase RNA specificity domain-containing protein, partial [Luminiphilus sp.]